MITKPRKFATKAVEIWKRYHGPYSILNYPKAGVEDFEFTVGQVREEIILKAWEMWVADGAKQRIEKEGKNPAWALSYFVKDASEYCLKVCPENIPDNPGKLPAANGGF